VPTDSHPQHVVTAVIVAHDGSAWLPRLLEALNEQTKPVQRVVAVDTGSRDRSGSVLAALLGQSAVFGMDRSAGYAAAVRRAVQHKAANSPVPGSPSGRAREDQVEWLWLLHDDCEPAADALEQLLRGAAESPTAAVLGPKLMDWTDRDVIVEAGVTIDTAGRRVTGIEPREVDQGQHDGDRDTLAVSSAGMLIRRDVWEQTGGFDPGIVLFGEDVDFCWRVYAVGYRVRVITDAVVFHAQAASRRRRAVSVGRRPRLLERRNSLVTLFGNLPLGPMVMSIAGNLLLSTARIIFYLIAKRPTAALDESAAAFGVVGHPVKLASARRRRARGRRAAYSKLRADLPAGRSIRRFVEFAAMMLARTAPEDLAGAHHATDDPTDDDSLLVDTGLLQRLLTRPGVLLTLGLIVIAAFAERRLVTGGTLGGGSLLPAWEGATGLWSEFLRAYHPTGTGSATMGPPYVGFVALLATILLGKAWLAVDVLLLGSVPLAGVTAFLALRRVTTFVAVRVWAAASYALLPIAFGAISAGRLGSAVAFVLIPLIGLLAGRMFSQGPQLARRAAWAIGLAVTVGAAFVPLLWPMAVAAVVVAGLGLRRHRGTLINLAIVALTPAVLLLPWLVPLLEHPSQLLLEAGIQQPGLASAHLPARSLLLLSPGGPGLPPYWVSGALLLTALAALLASRRLALIVSGWVVAILGFAVGLGVSRVTVTPVGGQPVVAWPGVALAVAAAGLLLAAAAGADSLGARLSRGGRTGIGRLASPRGFAATVLALAACSAPVLAAAYWLMNGVSGPIGPASGGQVVPSLVSSTGGTGRQLRTLVVTSSGGHVSYLLLRGGSPQFADPNLTPVPAAETALSRAVAALVAPNGGEAVNQSQLLARFDIGFVLMRAPVDANLASVLDGVPGLTGVSMTPQFDLWRLTTLPSRVSVLEPDGAVVPVASGPIGVAGSAVPTAGGTVLLAEPAGNWSASVNGHALTPVVSPLSSWAQAFKLPSGGGTLTISRNALVHDLVMALELLAILVVAALALPGIRTAAELEAAASTSGSRDAVPAGSSGTAGDVTGGRPSEREPALSGAGRVGGEAMAARSAGPREAGPPAPVGGPAYARGQVAADMADEQSAPDRSSRPGRRRTGSSRRDRFSRSRKLGRGGRSAPAAGGARTRLPSRDEAAQGPDAGAGPSGDRRGAGLPEPSRAGGAVGAAGGVTGAAVGAVTGRRRARSQPDPLTTERSYGDGSRYGDQPHEGPPGYTDAPRRRPLSPSGTFEEPYGTEASGQDSPSPYGREPGYGERGGYGGVPDRDSSRDYDSRRGYAGGRDYDGARGHDGSAHQDEAGYPGRGGYADERGRGYADPPDNYPGRAGNDDRRGYDDRGGYDDRRGYVDQRGYSEDTDYGRGRGGGGGSSREAPDQSSGWPSSAQWPSSGEQRGWPEPDQQQWPEAGDGLEALPGEVHHDWPSREDRTARGWPAPSGDGEDETW
jgi:GT2 family glycosyltransferase